LVDDFFPNSSFRLFLGLVGVAFFGYYLFFRKGR